MKIKMEVDFHIFGSNTFVCYFNSHHDKNIFLEILNRVSKQNYTYRWKEIED